MNDDNYKFFIFVYFFEGFYNGLKYLALTLGFATSWAIVGAVTYGLYILVSR